MRVSHPVFFSGNILRGAAVISALCLCACVSGPWSTAAGSGGSSGSEAASEKTDANHWLTPPAPNGLVIVGVSGRMTKRDTEIQNAREDAARKVSMYYGVYAEVENSQYTGAGFFEIAVDTTVKLEYDQQIEQYLDKLVFDPKRDVFTRNNAVYIRFTYPEPFPGDISYLSDKNPNGNPKWTTNPPHEINGFPAGVGVARRQERLRDTVMKSYEAAAASFVSNISSSVTSGEVATSNQGASFVREQSRGRLTSFLVLETWIDPASEAVWTLAVARSAN
jgi:hypothetical protein